MKFKLFLMALCFIASTLWASEATFRFDPNDLIGLYTTGDPTAYRPGQTNPRFLNRDGYSVGTGVAATYTDHPSRGSRWTGDDDYYADWLAGLGAGEGIYQFNMWVTTTNYPYSGYLREDSGEQLARNGMYNNDATGLTGTAADGWTAEVDVIYSNTTGGVTYGIIWKTTDSAAYLRPGGADIGEFSFSMTDVIGIREVAGDIVDGDEYRVWFGSDSLTFDDQGWGTTSGRDAFDGSDAHWEGELAVTAEVIPEPATSMFMAVGAVFAGLMRLKQRLS